VNGNLMFGALAAGTITKPPGDTLRCYDTATNTGNVSIHLGIQQVLEGPETVYMGMVDYGVVSPTASVSIDQTDNLPTTVSPGDYTHYLNVVDLDTNEQIVKHPTGWVVTIQTIKSVEITDVTLV